VASVLLWFFSATSIEAADPDLPNFARYQVPFGSPSTSAADAVADIPDRAGSVINWNACGREIDFFGSDGKRNDDGLRDGDVYPQVLGKITWIAANTGIFAAFPIEPYCSSSLRTFAVPDLRDWLNWPKAGSEHGSNHIYSPMLGWPSHAGFDGDDPTALWNEAFKWRWGEFCAGILQSVTPETVGGLKSYLLEFSVSRRCMIAQINATLLSRSKVGNSGTSGLPCSFVDTAGPGDWDMAVISLVRAVYLNKLFGGGAIGEKAGKHVFDNLLTISGEMMSDSYGPHECGNGENDTGSAQDRADEEDFYDGFFSELGDVLEWLFKWLIMIVIAAILIALGVSIVGALLTGTIAVPIGVAIVVAMQVRIPETENHLLMINSSRYLTNQLMIETFTDEGDLDRYNAYQDEIREWLLLRLQRITRKDFMEYNAKPYQRLSIAAILNIHDFATDDKLKTAARIVLETASAKFAVGSNQGRRIVPFRRLMETNRFEAYGPGQEGMKPRRITDFGSGADHQVAAMLLFTGQTQQLPGDAFGSRNVSIDSTGEMIWEATSLYVVDPERPDMYEGYRPHEVVLDLAINKSVPYEQRFHHAGFEIYSSGQGFLVTAGGVTTPHALGMLFTLFQFNIPPPFEFKLKNADRGAGVPTTLMVASGEAQLNRNEFIRIEGAFGDIGHEDRNPAIPDIDCETNKDKAYDKGCSRNLTNDHNLCVRKGFACGINLTIPTPINSSCVHTLPGAAQEWAFIDSTTCPQYRDADPFYVVIFRRPCPPGHEYCKGQWGFFEAVDRPVATPDPTFAEFMQATVDRNPNALLPLAASMIGEYRSWRGESINYSVLGHQADSDKSGIVAINGIVQGDIDDWKLAEGDAITADGEGRVSIRSPGRQPAPGRVMRIEIDFTDWENPIYQEQQ
jgi:hypothetical protein